MQAGLISNPMNDMSSCESDSMEDPSLRRSLRGAGRKSKVRTAGHPFPLYLHDIQASRCWMNGVPQIATSGALWSNVIRATACPFEFCLHMPHVTYSGVLQYSVVC